MSRTIAAILFLVSCCAPPGLAQAKATRIRVAENVMQRRLIKRVDPPPTGDAAHIRGDVVFKAHIGKDGNIESLQSVSGHPMLVPPAIEAEAVEIQTCPAQRGTGEH